MAPSMRWSGRRLPSNRLTVRPTLMNRRTTSAFTVVEIMIVIVIIGMLAAMAIPAFMRVRVASLEKAAAQGRTLTEDERQYLRDHRSMMSKPARSERSDDEVQTPMRAARTPATPSLKTLTSNGIQYYLVPKTSGYPAELTIGSDTYYMVPVGP
jgi:prepilin-type N-terminal cleavage/methylation domain-containing protein